MNLARWTFLFMSTVGIGILVALGIGLAVQFADPDYNPVQIGLQGFGYNLVGTVIVGALLGAFSHLGFFAYLTMNYFAQGIIRSKTIWAYAQIFLIVVISVYSAVLRAKAGEPIIPYFFVPAVLLIASLPIARLKVKQTNRNSFVPTLFFLTAVTLLEAVPALRQYNPYGTLFMVAPLFACNAWQIMQLHKLLGTERNEPAGRA
ncbi:KinB-signaling pathway activation protein [Paenibacillus alkalitolerans]|uniref:KinB-signaling pathway activation protein n=1 Tax=Paenibacillus alkalitolerans TaxID=2799335 RepID=UPI0018F7B15E|nr:KinB-signaling pathway activation protein [Paenibacillus alkalitolerans]